MMQKDTLGDYFECSRLGKTEVLSTIGVALTVFFLVTIPTLIRHFHLTHAQTILLDNIGHHITKGLAVLDALSFTNTVVTFLFWGLVGIIIYGFTTVMVRLWQLSQEDKELASDEYIHPADFSRQAYWRQILEKEAFSTVLLAAELIVTCALLFWAFPFALLRLSAMLSAFSLLQLFHMVLWVAIIAALFCLGRLMFRAWRYRHILFEL